MRDYSWQTDVAPRGQQGSSNLIFQENFSSLSHWPPASNEFTSYWSSGFPRLGKHMRTRTCAITVEFQIPDRPYDSGFQTTAVLQLFLGDLNGSRFQHKISAVTPRSRHLSVISSCLLWLARLRTGRTSTLSQKINWDIYSVLFISSSGNTRFSLSVLFTACTGTELFNIHALRSLHYPEELMHFL